MKYKRCVVTDDRCHGCLYWSTVNKMTPAISRYMRLKRVHRVTPDLIQHTQYCYTDRRRAMSHSNTPPVRNRPPLTVRSSSLRCVSAAEHHTVEQYQKTGRTKPRKHPKKRCTMEHSPGLPQDTKSLRSCSGNRAKMLLKGHLGIKCHSQYNKVIRLLQYSSVNR